MNLIPLNPTAGFPGRATPGRHLHEFARRLQASGVGATVRRTRGTEIDAACGQLRRRTLIPSDPPASTTMGPCASTGS